MKKVKLIAIPSGIIFLILFSISCNPERRPSSHTYSKVEVYCMGMKDIVRQQSLDLTSTLETPARITAKKFIHPSSLYFSSTDSNLLKRLSSAFFNNIESKDTVGSGTDTRFLFLLKRSDDSADTLVYYSYNQIFFNEKIKITYRYSIIDSIRAIIGKPQIDCISED